MKEIRRTPKECIFSREFGSPLKRLTCIGTHIWKRHLEIIERKGSLKKGRIVREVILFRCKVCDRYKLEIIEYTEFK